MKEIYLSVVTYSFGFEVFRSFRSPDWQARDSVVKLDYNYIPWPRKEGNLLW